MVTFGEEKRLSSDNGENSALLRGNVPTASENSPSVKSKDCLEAIEKSFLYEKGETYLIRLKY